MVDCLELFGVERCMFESNLPVDLVTLSPRERWAVTLTLALTLTLTPTNPNPTNPTNPDPNPNRSPKPKPKPNPNQALAAAVQGRGLTSAQLEALFRGNCLRYHGA